jgi:hypothetical protein
MLHLSPATALRAIIIPITEMETEVQKPKSLPTKDTKYDGQFNKAKGWPDS